MTDAMSAPVLTPRFDSFANAPEYHDLRAAFDARDWPGFESELLEMRTEEQSHALTLLSEHDEGVDDFLTAAEGEHPGSAAAATALAIRRIAVGWEHRTTGDSSEVSAEELAEFWRHLRLGERALVDVCAAHPEYIPAWTARLVTARGLQLGKSEGYRRFRRNPGTRHDVSAQIALQQFVEPKWFGTRDEADDFARNSASSALDGSNSGALVAIMHLEHWAATGGGQLGQAQLIAPGVLDELRVVASRTVLHPSHQLTPLGVVAHSAFLLVYWLADALVDAGPHLDVLGERAARFPLEYAGNGTEHLATIWREVQAIAPSAAREAK